MNRKRNVNFIKPEDPAFLKRIKKQAGYDDRNHKFDELQNAEEDFVDDTDNDQPQVVVLRKGDLTAEEAAIENEIQKKKELEVKADLNKRVIFKHQTDKILNSKESKTKKKDTKLKEKRKQLLSFQDDDVDD